MKKAFTFSFALICLLTGLDAQEIRLHSVTNARQSGGDAGYTLDGIRMSFHSRPKLQNPDYFSEDGIVEKYVTITDAYGETGSLEAITGSDDIDLFYFGTFDMLEPSYVPFTDGEVDSLYAWSKRGGKLIIGGVARLPDFVLYYGILYDKWGFDIMTDGLGSIVDILPTTEGLNSTLFEGPFGSVPLAHQGGSLQGYFSSIPEDAVVLALDTAGNPTLILDCATLDLIISDCDAWTDLSGVSLGIEIQNDNDEFWLNTIAYMDDLQGPPVVVQDGNTLSAGSHLSYQWMLGGQPITGATDSIYTITEEGNYSVAVSMSCGCNATSEEVFVTLTSIENVFLNGELLAFPNPATDFLTLEFTLLESADIELNVFNAAGIRMPAAARSANLSGGRHAVPVEVSGLPPGAYSLEVRTADGVATLKFSKQ